MIDAPAGKLNVQENIIFTILNGLRAYKKELLEGIWNNKVSTPDEIFYIIGFVLNLFI